MAMEHKAYAFDYQSFDRELRSMLESALMRDDPSELEKFIDGQRALLKDPYEGDPLEDGWRGLIETKDSHQYGQFALTKYYDPVQEMGLGDQWIDVQDLLLKQAGTDAPVLGRPIGPADRLFDPWKLGSYFQSEEEVRSHLGIVAGIGPKTEALRSLEEILRKASDGRRGLYVTF
jgi:hypothetical protein